jgi:inner membrane transporter RhtA
VTGEGYFWPWGATLALMNVCFDTAISRLPLATVSAIEFLPVIA